MRYDIDEEIYVLLVACRDIACDEKLYCDYNAKENAYPAHHFLQLNTNEVGQNRAHCYNDLVF